MCARMSLNQKGMSLVMVLVITGIVGIAASTIVSTSSQKRKVSQHLNVSVSASLVKQKLVGIVLAPQSWQAIQTYNTQAFTNFNANSPPSLNIYTADSNVPFYQTTNAQAGFDLKGNPCTEFSANGNDNCPLRYDITLRNHVFQNGNWIDTIHFELSFKPATYRSMLNTSNHDLSFDLVRNLNDQSVESACISVHGVYDSTANACSIQVTKAVTACGGGLTYRGPAPNGSANNCDAKTTAIIACGGNQVVKGFDTRGNSICGAAL